MTLTQVPASLYPVVADFIGTNRPAQYYSILIPIADNLILLKRSETSKTARRTSLRHLRCMMQSKEHHK